ncbi:hypothetical protein C8J56DRAFT_1053046 [Mycena floridula]|nr:hypothetical protein C8J56DRAFT_1053046 [Mycena floridula]
MDNIRKLEGGSLVLAEDVKLLLPSDLNARQQGRGGMADGLDEIESRLRDAQCRDALDALRNQLLIKSRLLTYKTFQIALCAKRYQAAWAAKLKLAGGKKGDVGWKKLEPGDVRPMQDVEETKKEMLKQVKRSRKRKRKEGEAPDEEDAAGIPPAEETTSASRKVLSWIWSESGASGMMTDEALEDGLRVEWAKAWARLRRWKEEVALLREEMRRVLVTLEWKACWWEDRVTLGFDDDARSAGAYAYASRQAAIQCRIRLRFKSLWATYDIEDSLEMRETEEEQAGRVLAAMEALTVDNGDEEPLDIEGENLEGDELDDEEVDDAPLDPDDDPLWE